MRAITQILMKNKGITSDMLTDISYFSEKIMQQALGRNPDIENINKHREMRRLLEDEIICAAIQEDNKDQ